MKEFTLKREEKVTVWKSYRVTVRAKSLEEAAKWLLETNDFAVDESEEFYETEELLTPEQNNGFSTVEIRNEDGDIILQNV
jgi:hypothetical protein